MKNPTLFSKLLEWQVYTSIPFIVASILISILMAYYLYKLKKNSDYILN